MANKPVSKGRKHSNSTRHPGAVDSVKGRAEVATPQFVKLIQDHVK